MASSGPTNELQLRIRLSDIARRKLVEQASRAGRPLDDYASDLLEHATATADLDAILAPLRKEFVESGSTEEELIEQINEARDDYYASRKADEIK